MSNYIICLYRSIIFCVLGLPLTGCMDIQGPKTPDIASSDVLSNVSLGSTSVMIAKGDSLQLRALAMAMDSSIIEMSGNKFSWKSVDPSLVHIDSVGKIIGRTTTVVPVDIIVSLTYGPVTKADTVSVHVTETKINATSIKIELLDSNRVGAFPLLGYPRVSLDLYDGDVLIEKGVKLPVEVASPLQANPVLNEGPEGKYIYEINNDKGYIGRFWVKSSVNFYGNIIADSLEFWGLYPAAIKSIPVLLNFATGTTNPHASGFIDSRVNVQPCAFIIVTMAHFGGPIDAVFSDSSASDNECQAIESADLNKDLLNRVNSLGSVSQIKTGSNLTGLSAITLGLRRSSTKGKIDVYIRNSATKERYPVEVRYHQIDIGETSQ